MKTPYDVYNRLNIRNPFVQPNYSTTQKLSTRLFYLDNGVRLHLKKILPLTYFQRDIFDYSNFSDEVTYPMPNGTNSDTNEPEDGVIALGFIDMFDLLPKGNIRKFIKSLRKFANANEGVTYGCYFSAEDVCEIKNYEFFFDMNSNRDLCTINISKENKIAKYISKISFSILNLSNSMSIVMYRLHICQSAINVLLNLYQMQVQSELRITRAFNVKWYNFKRLIAGSYKAEEYKRYLIDNFIKEIKWQVAKELSKTFEVYFHFKKSLLPSINIWETNLLEERENDSFLKSVGFDICSDYSVEYNSYLSWNNMVGQECNNSIDYICSTKKIPNYEEISKSRISINFGPYLVSSCLLWIEKGNLRKFNPKISKAVSKEKYRITKLLKLKIKIEASIYYEKRFLTEFTGATLGDVYKYFRHYNQANNHTITQLRFEELITRKETVEKMLNDLFSLFDTTIEYRNSQQNFKLQLWLVVITIISLFVSFISFIALLLSHLQ